MSSEPSAHVPPLEQLLALDQQFCFALHATARRVVRAYRPVLDELELTYPQYLVMLVLWQWDHEAQLHPTLSALGERLDLDSGTLTPLLYRLEQKQLVVRERSQRDERELFVRVTQRGRSLKQRAAKVPLSLLAQCPLPLDELLALRDQLNRLRSLLSADDAL